MSTVCKTCGERFEVSDWELNFLKKFTLSSPSTCPDCRQQLRLLHVNQIHLFRRQCDATGETVISNYPPDSGYRVYSQQYWWSDGHDGGSFGRSYDSSRPFFEQFQELNRQVPRPALFTDFSRDENCAYTNFAGLNKDCYMIFDSDENRECYYSYGMNGSQSAMDCYRVQKVELCYEAVDCTNCYNCAFIYNSENCFDCAFINNCIGCKKCVMCSNLQQKEYYYRNERVSPGEFERIWLTLKSRRALESLAQEFEGFKAAFPQKYLRGYQNENVSGNYLVNCKNAEHCYDSMNVWDCRFCSQVFMSLRDSLDCHECGDSQLLYQCSHLGYNAYNVMFSSRCLNQLTNLAYCLYCFNGCADLFGCVGLKRRQYCILNRRYSEAEYRALRALIVDNMKQRGEWGEYFPAACSAFPYNLTVAQEAFPLQREEAKVRGYRWHENYAPEHGPATSTLADNIDEVPAQAAGATLVCAQCRKGYRIIRAELRFYRMQGLAAPSLCFFCRHQQRLSARNPRYLWRRRCSCCNAEIETTYAPRRPEKVCCESCYLQSLL